MSTFEERVDEHDGLDDGSEQRQCNFVQYLGCRKSRKHQHEAITADLPRKATTTNKTISESGKDSTDQTSADWQEAV
jgi:hypothetical protein